MQKDREGKFISQILWSPQEHNFPLLQWDIRQLVAAAAFSVPLGSHPLLGLTATSRTQQNLKNHFLWLHFIFPSIL